MIGGLVDPSEGSVTIFDKSPARARREGRVGMVFQSPVLLEWRTVRQNVMLGTEIPPRPEQYDVTALPLLTGAARLTRWWRPGSRRRRRELGEEKAKAMLRLVGLQGFECAQPWELSGGMKARVALARALMSSPQLLLMDEPFGSLDSLTRLELQGEFLRLRQTEGLTVVIVTHDVQEAVLMSDSVLVLSSRPARIQARIDVRFEGERNVSVRQRPEFQKFVHEVEQELGL